MIDAEGYPVLVDFGCSKYCPDKTYTFIGTPNYVAPEIITNAGHNRCVDYWALGVTVYEMITGENPFFFDGMDQATLYHAICEEKHYPLSDGKSATLVDFIDRLLEKNPAQRLGMLAKGVDDVFGHPWLERLDLERIRAKQWNAPWKVLLSEDKDSEDVILRKLGMCIPQPSLDDPMTSRDVRHTDDSTASIGDPSEREPSLRSIIEEDDVSVGSLVEEEMEIPNVDRKKKKTKKKKSSDGTRKKKITDVTAEYQFVTPTTVTYFNIKKPNRNLAKMAQDRADSKSRRSVLKGTLRDLGIDSDDDDDDFNRYLAQK
jgi:serine/threonine protein kinase